MLNTSRLAIALLAGLTILTADPSHAQLKRFLRRVITDTVGSELTNQFNRVVRESIRCAVRDPMCYRRATAAGHDVVFYGDSGDIIQNDEGLPVQKPADLPADYQAAYGERLDDVQGSSVPTAAGALQRSGVLDRGYDFEPGSRELVYEDYSQDRVGDFPRGLEFRRGDISVVAVDGRRVLMVRGDGELDLPLSETLPEQFTLEFEVLLGRFQTVLVGPHEGKRPIHHSRYPRHRFQIADNAGSGVAAGGASELPVAIRRPLPELADTWTPIRIMVGGSHAKMYVGEDRVANLPNGDFPRSDFVRFYFQGKGDTFVGPIRVAAGGRDLYQVIEAEGRVAVHDILFDLDVTTPRPESDEVLERIASMLQVHPQLRLVLEGHTDSTGDFDHNLKLSSGRAAAVKQWLVEERGIDPDRLRTMGLGSTQPKSESNTETAHRQNRRVELVRIN